MVMLFYELQAFVCTYAEIFTITILSMLNNTLQYNHPRLRTHKGETDKEKGKGRVKGQEMEMIKEKALEQISRYFPKGSPRVDDRRGISGIVYVLRNGLKWKGVPKGWSVQNALQPIHSVEQRRSVCQDFAEVSKSRDESVNDGRNPFESTQNSCKSRGRGASLRPKIGCTKGGLGSKLHAVCDASGRPVRLLLTAGNVSDIVGARELMKDFTGCGLPIG
jgi:transposase